MGPISPADNVEVTLEASATSVVVEFVYEPSLPAFQCCTSLIQGISKTLRTQ